MHLDGSMFSCSSRGIKLGGGIGNALSGRLLDLGGYVDGAASQPASAVSMMSFMDAVIPYLPDKCAYPEVLLLTTPTGPQLYGEAKRLHEMFAAKGVRHEYREYTSEERRLDHVFNVTDPEWPESIAANRDMLAWFQRRRALRGRGKPKKNGKRRGACIHGMGAPRWCIFHIVCNILFRKPLAKPYQILKALHILVKSNSRKADKNMIYLSMTDLEKWSVFFQYAPDPTCRETVNRIIASEEVLQMAGNLLMSISKDEEERAHYRSRKKFEWDLASGMATMREVSLEEGRAEGAFNARLGVLRDIMSSFNVSLDQAMTALKIPESDRQKYRDVLLQQ